MIENGAAMNQNGRFPEVIKSEVQSSGSEMREIRVAFYVRVSTDTEEQMNSFENQKAAVDVILRQHPEYKLVKIYADAGISGTLAEKRPGFTVVQSCGNAIFTAECGDRGAAGDALPAKSSF